MPCNIDILYNHFKKSTGITTDSRSVKPGNIFFALEGENFDGNRFADEAIEKGASLAVISNPAYGKNSRDYLLAGNVLEALQQLAAHHRKKYSLPVIAITGSNGKTTTKELIGRVISEKYRVTSTQGNLNNHIGLPLTLLEINDDTEIVVTEMGANHRGEIAGLCEIAGPGYGIITNIGKAHLEGFGGLEGVIKAKSELYNYIIDNEGTLFVNADNHLLMELSGPAGRITYSLESESDYRVTPSAGAGFAAGFFEREGTLFNVTSKLYGSYNLENIACAVSVGLHFNVPPEKVAAAIESYRPDNMRSQILGTENNEIYLDAYNANPTSLENALRFFETLPGGPKMLILGDMLELGAESVQEHGKMMQAVLDTGIGEVILVGPEFVRASAGTGMPAFKEVESAARWLRDNPVKNMKILVKGSRGIRLEKLIDLL